VRARRLTSPVGSGGSPVKPNGRVHLQLMFARVP
jgi:hypothetical protein